MDDVRQRIVDRVKVTRQMVIVAKALIFDECKSRSESSGLIEHVVRKHGAVMPERVIVHQSHDASDQIRAAGDVLSWRLAAAEGIWSLVHGGLLMPSAAIVNNEPNLAWTTIGTKAGWQFEEFAYEVPQQVRRSPSSMSDRNCFLTDPDLFLGTMNIGNMHVEVESALREPCWPPQTPPPVAGSNSSTPGDGTA
jgi:hypothetical protein